MVKIWSIKKNGQNLEHQKEWSKFGASKRMVEIWSIKKNGQNLEHQKEWSKFGASKRMVKIWGIKKNGQNSEHQKEWSKFGASKRMVKIWSTKKNGQNFPVFSYLVFAHAYNRVNGKNCVFFVSQGKLEFKQCVVLMIGRLWSIFVGCWRTWFWHWLVGLLSSLNGVILRSPTKRPSSQFKPLIKHTKTNEKMKSKNPFKYLMSLWPSHTKKIRQHDWEDCFLCDLLKSIFREPSKGIFLDWRLKFFSIFFVWWIKDLCSVWDFRGFSLLGCWFDKLDFRFFVGRRRKLLVSWRFLKCSL